MKEKVVWLRDPREVVYKPERWDYLEKLRELAGKLGEALGPGGHVHGSLARGDVTKSSDIDIILTGGAQSYELELRLEEAGYRWQKRELVMATPNATPKGHLHVAENVTVTFPLAGFRPQEEAFYKFGGMLAAIGIESAGRVPGVNKKLLLIIPNDKGHTESSIIGRPAPWHSSGYRNGEGPCPFEKGQRRQDRRLHARRGCRRRKLRERTEAAYGPGPCHQKDDEGTQLNIDSKIER